VGRGVEDGGKKGREGLAFEDIGAFLKAHYEPAASLDDYKGTGKPPYEKFYLDQMDHHTRVGFLHQKLREPRSYDYDRLRKWDERLRMPQFKFARTDRRANESEEEFRARSERAEAEAREAGMSCMLG